MRLLIFLLFTTGAYGFELSRYDGEVYPSRDLILCQEDLKAIIKSIDSLEGYQFVEGNCGKSSRRFIQLRFSYTHPYTSRIERLHRRLPNRKTCEYYSRVVSLKLSNMGISPIASFCIGSSLIVDYIDEAYNRFSSLHLPIQFEQEHECRRFVNDLSNKFATRKIYSIINTCKKVFITVFKHGYTPIMHLGAAHDVQIKTIVGKRSSLGDCDTTESKYDLKFGNANVKLLHAGCSRMGDSEFEFLIYMKDFESSWIKEFIGSTYSEVSECVAQLERAVEAISAQGNSALYSYCKQFSYGLTPIVYFVEKGV